jgi:phosphoglycolate phosphatase
MDIEDVPSSTRSSPRILLFDIDGTLLSANGAGKRALSLAFEDVCGRGDAVDGIDFRGMTDALVIEQALATQSGPSRSLHVNDIYAAYLRHLERELAESRTARVLPGVKSLLDALIARGGQLAIGLGTGNIEPAAYMKVNRVGLGSYFTFGGFGSDHRVRSEIIRIGATRGSLRLGCTLAKCQVVVIGDTFHDIDAALAIGARAVGVGTSGRTPQELLARGATHAFETLQDSAVLAALLD